MDITKVNVNGVEANLGGSSGGVEMFNIAELDRNAVGSGQAILDAYNAGMKLVYIDKAANSYTSGTATECRDVVSIIDGDVSNNSSGETDEFNYVYVCTVYFQVLSMENGEPTTPNMHVAKYKK